jgi:hypothetical protein
MPGPVVAVAPNHDVDQLRRRLCSVGFLVALLRLSRRSCVDGTCNELRIGGRRIVAPQWLLLLLLLPLPIYFVDIQRFILIVVEHQLRRQ